jgi:hypothetical protein
MRANAVCNSCCRADSAVFDAIHTLLIDAVAAVRALRGLGAATIGDFPDAINL